jgi:hypothetical protein
MQNRNWFFCPDGEIGRRSGLKIVYVTIFASRNLLKIKYFTDIPAKRYPYTTLPHFRSFGRVRRCPRMSEHHTILGGKVHVYKRSNSSSWQCASYLAGKNRRTTTKEDSLS